MRNAQAPKGEPTMGTKPSHELIDQFLATSRIAVVGTGRNRNDFARGLFRELKKRGYDALPVNPNADTIEDCRCYARLQEIDPPPGAALVMAPRGVVMDVLNDCLAAGIGLVWLHGQMGPDKATAEAEAFCAQHGISLIPGYCPYMFLPDAIWIHRFHRWVMGLMNKMPA
jgi:uncharacterized protein